MTKKKESSNISESELENTTDEELPSQEEGTQDTEETVNTKKENPLMTILKMKLIN